METSLGVWLPRADVGFGLVLALALLLAPFAHRVLRACLADRPGLVPVPSAATVAAWTLDLLSQYGSWRNW